MKIYGLSVQDEMPVIHFLADGRDPEEALRYLNEGELYTAESRYAYVFGVMPLDVAVPIELSERGWKFKATVK